MKATLISLLTIGALFVTGCTTPVAIDPMTGQQQEAEYFSGFFYAPLDAPMGEIFKTAIRELDAMGYYRTGELHKETEVYIYARKVGDEKVTLKLYQPREGKVQRVRIRIGKLGNLPESQAIYARIRDSL